MAYKHKRYTSAVARFHLTVMDLSSKATNLGFIKYSKVNANAKKIQSPPTMRYANPRKSFFPPSQVAVERINFFLPPKL